MTYIRQTTRNRETGSRVTIYDTNAPENAFDPDGGRWVTFCEDHHSLVNHVTLADAQYYAAHPLAWCEECRDSQ